MRLASVLLQADLLLVSSLGNHTNHERKGKKALAKLFILISYLTSGDPRGPWGGLISRFVYI